MSIIKKAVEDRNKAELDKAMIEEARRRDMLQRQKLEYDMRNSYHMNNNLGDSMVQSTKQLPDFRLV